MGKDNCSGFEKRQGRLDKKRDLGLLLLNKWSNNTQLVIKRGASSKRFIIFKLLFPKSKRINLGFLPAN